MFNLKCDMDIQNQKVWGDFVFPHGFGLTAGPSGKTQITTVGLSRLLEH